MRGVQIVLEATLVRLAPPGSPYLADKSKFSQFQVASLKALRRDCQEGFLTNIQGLVRAEVFADFLEMAEYLLGQGDKDAAAVLVGGVLEEALRGACYSRGLPTTVGAS